MPVGDYTCLETVEFAVDMERWQNKIAVVTGASAGIGAACCKDLVEHGMIVVGLARRLDVMQNTLKSLIPKSKHSRFHCLKCDVGNEKDIVDAFKWIQSHLGEVDVLINNAGCLRSTDIISPDNAQDLSLVLNTNVLGVALCTREAFQSMAERKVSGHIIIINSVVGHSVPVMEGVSMGMYAPSKHALTAMTEVLRQELMYKKANVKITVSLSN